MKPVKNILTISIGSCTWFARRCLVRIQDEVSTVVWASVVFPLDELDNTIKIFICQKIKNTCRIYKEEKYLREIEFLKRKNETS